MPTITYNDVNDLYQKLSVYERKDLYRLVTAPNTSSQSLDSFVAEERFANGRVCPLCGGTHIRRHGHQKNGKQRYLCMECHKTFQATTNSIVAHARKELSVFIKNCDCMARRMPLRETAAVCGVHLTTAFTWRHKILDALRAMSDDVVLDGIAEADETYFTVSYKGNHKKSRNFDMPRKAHERGGETHTRGLSTEKVCVASAVNRTGHSFAQVACLGAPKAVRLSDVLGNHFERQAVLCTDKTTAYRQIVKDKDLRHFKIDGQKTIGGIYHIQHINNYHSQLKAFINGCFKDVSTKYLNNYLVWYNLVNYSKKTRTQSAKILLSFTLTLQKRVRYVDIANREPLATAV